MIYLIHCLADKKNKYFVGGHVSRGNENAEGEEKWLTETIHAVIVMGMENYAQLVKILVII